MFLINYQKREKQIFLESDEKKLSYYDLKLNIVKLNELSKRKKLILLVSDNSFESIEIYFSLIQSKHIIMLLDYKVSYKELKNLIKNFKPNYIFFPSSIKNNLFDNKNRIYKFKKNYYFKKIYITNTENFTKNLKLLLSTSGSTSTRKFVKLTKKNITSNTLSIIDYLKISSKDNCIVNMPIAYSYMMSVLNSHFLMNAKIYHTNRSIMEKEFWKFFNEKKITSFNGVPTIYKFLLKLNIKRVFKHNLRYITLAGGKLDVISLKKIINFTSKRDIKFFNMYGQTEASPRISYLEPKFILNKIGSVGKSIKNSKIWITNKNDIKIKTPYTEGEINFSGPGVFHGYCENYEELKDSKIYSNKMKTGDLGYFDNDGFFFITGRNNRISKVQGVRINLDELQLIMNQRSYEIACKESKEIIKIFYTKNYNIVNLLKVISKVTGLNINSFITKKIKKFPHNSSDKIDYNKLN